MVLRQLSVTLLLKGEQPSGHKKPYSGGTILKGSRSRIRRARSTEGMSVMIHLCDKRDESLVAKQYRF